MRRAHSHGGVTPHRPGRTAGPFTDDRTAGPFTDKRHGRQNMPMIHAGPEPPFDSGIYVLFIRLPRRTRLTSGPFTGPFRRGTYLYVGSAQRGLGARLARHMRRAPQKRLRWHVDHILEHGFVVHILSARLPRPAEPALAVKLGSMYEPVPGFGSSDSPAGSHLFFSPGKIGVRDLRSVLGGLAEGARWTREP